MKKLLALSFLGLVACGTPDKKMEDFDWQGHRGARGELPENTVMAMQKALQAGVKTLEMDVVVTADSVVVLSHEPFLNPEICLDSNGTALSGNGKAYNIFEMTYRELQKFDCGSKGHASFPAQEKLIATKPTLLDVFIAAEEGAMMMNRPEPFYNIEIKSSEEWEGRFHPRLNTYVDLVIAVVQKANLQERVTIQSFDKRALRYLHEKYPQLKLALLVEEGEFSEHINQLGFFPAVYSPHHSLVSKSLVRDLHTQKVKVIPWTVNEISEAEELIKMGVDGIITDYPSRLILALKS